MSNTIRLHCQPDGKEIKIMKFEWIGGEVCKWFDSETKRKYVLRISKKGFEIYRIGNIPLDLNPLYLEFITEEECPECEGGCEPTKVNVFGEKVYDYNNLCPNCTDGRVEVVTQKVLFDPKKYERELIRLGSKLEYERPYYKEAESAELKKLRGE